MDVWQGARDELAARELQEQECISLHESKTHSLAGRKQALANTLTGGQTDRERRPARCVEMWPSWPLTGVAAVAHCMYHAWSSCFANLKHLWWCACECVENASLEEQLTASASALQSVTVTLVQSTAK